MARRTEKDITNQVLNNTADRRRFQDCHSRCIERCYLADVNEQAEGMLFQLVKQMAKDEGVDEAMKSRDQLYWIGCMNNIRNRAEEAVLNEIIYR